MDKRNLILTVGAVIIIAVIYFLFFYHSNSLKQNTDVTEILYNDCSSCSNGALGIVHSLFKSENIPFNSKNISFNTPEGLSLVSNFSVTALPTLILNETTISSKALNGLIYLNGFNVEGNNFVLNTPFLAGLAKGITYFDLIQNRTITSFDIFNQSYVYQNLNGSVINPSEILYLVNDTNYVYKNKTEISFVYSNSSFSAVQSFILYNALLPFGNFSNLSVMTSPSVSFSAGETLGNIQFYTINGNNYNSKYFNIESSSLQNLSSSPYINTLEKQLFEFDQNSAFPFFNNIGNFMPFLDIGGRYVEVSSMLNPRMFSDKNIQEIKQLIVDNKTYGTAFNNSVNFMRTMLCSYIGYSNAACNTSAIKNDILNINSLT